VQSRSFCGPLLLLQLVVVIEAVELLKASNQEISGGFVKDEHKKISPILIITANK